MKALSFRQPWAELIIQGKKKLDLRTWKTSYRGSLAVYASLSVEKEACRDFNIDPGELTAGAVIGIVDLVKVIKLDEAAFLARTGEHLNTRSYREPMYGWELANPRPLVEPKPAKGRIKWFDVDIDKSLPSNAVEDVGNEIFDLDKITTLPEITSPGSGPFELRVIPELEGETKNPAYRLALYQRRVAASPVQMSLYRKDIDQFMRIIELSNTILQSLADQVLDALRLNGYKATELSASRKEPFLLDEESGVRLGLLFMTVKPISKMSRVEAISEGIRRMTSEELYYWYSKCTSKPTAQRAQKALRILLAEE